MLEVATHNLSQVKSRWECHHPPGKASSSRKTFLFILECRSFHCTLVELPTTKGQIDASGDLIDTFWEPFWYLYRFQVPGTSGLEHPCPRSCTRKDICLLN
jgi:hypothetical protein